VRHHSRANALSQRSYLRKGKGGALRDDGHGQRFEPFVYWRGEKKGKKQERKGNPPRNYSIFPEKKPASLDELKSFGRKSGTAF